MIKDEKEINLLLDLIKIYKKYGSEPFAGLIKSLNDKEFLDTFTKVLENTSFIAKEKGIKPKGKKLKKLNLKDELLLLSQKDKQKSEILLFIYDKLISKTVLSTNKQLMNFASELGLNLTAKSRSQNIVSVMKTLIQLPIEKLSNIRIKFDVGNNYGDRSLEGWSNIILKKNSRNAN
ncbi:MAG: hypothetical protein M5U17_12725 [Ignavibacterium sp.]|nr:hypothetical protein [Ignavibacterium sp.]